MSDRTDPSESTPELRFTFVLGMHRSGSSALARVLNLAGLRISSRLLAANQDNPAGYWEPQRIVRFNDGLLAGLDRHWADPKPLPQDGTAREIDAHRPADAASLLLDEAASASGTGPEMVVKDPRLSRLMPFWRQALAARGIAPTCLIVCRHPMDVARSLYARDRLDRDHALALWLAYMLEAEAGTRGMNRRLVHYEALLADGAGTLRELEGVVAGMAAGDEAHRRRTLAGFLDAGLQHHRAASSIDAEDGPLQAMVRATYEAFRRPDPLAAGPLFDRLDRERREHWARTSPGPGGSGIVRQLPAWHAEQSWQFVAAGEFRQAVQALDRAIALAPDVARFHHLRGNALARLDELDAAIEAHRQAVAWGAAVPRFHRGLCDALNKAGRFVEAAQALGVLAELSPDAPTLHQLGAWLGRIDRHAQAVAALRSAVALDGSKAVYHAALATSLTHLGRRDEACEALGRAIACEPEDAGLHDRLGDLHAGAGRWPSACRAYDEAVRLRCRALHLGDAAAPAPPAAPLPKRTAATKGQLLSLLARRGARYWADDLDRRLRQHPPARVDSDRAWPLGPVVQERPTVPLPGAGEEAAPEGEAPLLSVMIPVYGVGREAWLRQCLESVLAQDIGADRAEIVVVDDASGDGTALRVCQSYGARIRCVGNPRNLGLVGNHNRCLSVARGSFVHILHQDDYVEPGFYEALLGPLQADERLVAGFTHNRFVDADGRMLSGQDPPRPPRGPLRDWHIRLSLETRIQFPSIIVRRSTYQRVGAFLPARRFSFDWDLWNRVAAAGPVWYEPRPLAQYRLHDASATSTFGLEERVVDAMQTVAAMVQLLPPDQRRSTAEMGIYKFFRRYWGLATEGASQSDEPGRRELIAFMTNGWCGDAETARLRALLDVIG